MAEQPQTFALPDLGEGLKEAEIVAWHVAEGDHVVADQPLVSVETDKAVVEVPSPWAGRIARLLAPVHTVILVGAPLVQFGETAEADTGTVVGSLTPTPAPRPRAAPAVRALAASHRIDLSAIAGTGPDGEITRNDVEQAASGRVQDGSAPLTGVRRAMALRIAEAGASVVPATVTEEADITTWPPDAPITAFLILAIVAGCVAEPALNASFDGGAMTRRINPAVHVGLAMDTPDGLFVPVLRDASGTDVETICARLEILQEAVEARTIAADVMRGATITLSNFGSIGGLFANLVVVPPQVAILGAGRIRARVIPAKTGFKAIRVLPLSLSFDHRAVSGGEATRFLAAVAASLESAA